MCIEPLLCALKHDTQLMWTGPARALGLASLRCPCLLCVRTHMLGPCMQTTIKSCHKSFQRSNHTFFTPRRYEHHCTPTAHPDYQHVGPSALTKRCSIAKSDSYECLTAGHMHTYQLRDFSCVLRYLRGAVWCTCSVPSMRSCEAAMAEALLRVCCVVSYGCIDEVVV